MDKVLNFHFRGGRLAYRRMGNGPAVLLAFHGIGQDNTCFEPFAQSLAQSFTIFSFDLFYHGHSSCVHGEAYTDIELLTKSYWKQLLTAFLHEHEIQRFSVAGFSMGGKFAIATAELFADQLEELWLLAPDGITISPWYQLATHTRLGRVIFRYFLKHLSVFRRVGHLLTSMRLLDRSALRFAESTLATPEQRVRVYRSWLGFRTLGVNMVSFSDLMNHRPVRIRLFLGYFDRVLPMHYMLPLTKRLHAYELHVFKTGHNRLVQKVAEEFLLFR